MYNFVDREVTNPMTFILTENANGTITLTPAPGTVVEEGTPINRATMMALQQNIYDSLYPIGSCKDWYDTADHSNFLNQTWERVGDGCAFVGYKAEDPNYGQIGVEFGTDQQSITYNGSSGATTLTINQIPSHSHGVNDSGHTHTVRDPGHSHNITYGSGTTASNWTPGKTLFQGDGYSTWATAAAATGISLYNSTTGITIQSNGGGGSHTHTINHTHSFSVIQKSMAFARWRRTA